jgi:hypothetical protein
MTNVVMAPDSWTPPPERPDCAGLAAGTCTTTPVVHPEQPAISLPVTGGVAWAWPFGIGLVLAGGGTALIVTGRYRRRILG